MKQRPKALDRANKHDKPERSHKGDGIKSKSDQKDMHEIKAEIRKIDMKKKGVEETKRPQREHRPSQLGRPATRSETK